MFNQIFLSPAMIETRVEYIHARPFGQTPITETGTVTAFKVARNGQPFVFVQPDTPHLFPRWREAGDVIRCLKSETTLESAVR